MRNLFSAIFIGMFGLMSCQGDGSKSGAPNIEVPLPKELVEVQRGAVPSDSVLKALCVMNLKGLTEEDMMQAMEPLDTLSPYMEKAHYSIQGAFMVYNMEFNLHSFEVLRKSDTACVALVKHDSRNHNERTYDPTRSTQEYTYKPRNGVWRITKMVVIGSDPL